MVQMETRVFRRIIENHKEAAVESIADTMEETYRFGCFGRPYIEGCARNRFQKKLRERSSR